MSLSLSVSPSSSSDAAPQVREAQDADAGAVSILLGELGYPTDTQDARERLAATLADPRCLLLVAVRGLDVLGFVSTCLVPYFPDGSQILRVTALAVSEHVRRRRVGSALIERVLEVARAHACSGIEVTTADQRLAAHAFYEGLGFTRTSSRFFRATHASQVRRPTRRRS